MKTTRAPKVRTPRLTATGFEQLNLFGDTIDVVVASDGFGYASVQRMCKSIGIDEEAQRQKLNGYHWARTVIIKARDARGYKQDAYALRHEDVACWLMTIHPSKVAFGVREKLKMWQTESAAVLGAWWHSKTQPLAEIVLVDPEAEARLDQMGALMAGLERELAATRDQVEGLKGIYEHTRDAGLAAQSELRSELRVLAARFDSVTNPLQPGRNDYMTLREFRDHARVLDQFGQRLPDHRLAVVGRALAAECRSLGLPVVRLGGPSKAGANAYPVGILYAWKIRNDLANAARKADGRRRTRAAGPDRQREFF